MAVVRVDGRPLRSRPTVDDRPVDADHSVVDDYLRDLFDRDGVEYEEMVEEYDRDLFETAWERAARLRGAVVVVVPGDDGLLLVENDWMDGYGFPGGGVEPDEDWEAAAACEVAEETGVRVEAQEPIWSPAASSSAATTGTAASTAFGFSPVPSTA